jgi:hypothetical protein
MHRGITGKHWASLQVYRRQQIHLMQQVFMILLMMLNSGLLRSFIGQMMIRLLPSIEEIVIEMSYPKDCRSGSILDV